MRLILLLLGLSVMALSQPAPATFGTFTGSTPSGSCANGPLQYNFATGLYGCLSGTWTQLNGGGGGTPGGSNTQVQFNDSGAFGGNSGFTFNKATGNVGIGTSVPGGSPSGTIAAGGDTVSGAEGAFHYYSDQFSLVVGDQSFWLVDPIPSGRMPLVVTNQPGQTSTDVGLISYVDDTTRYGFAELYFGLGRTSPPGSSESSYLFGADGTYPASGPLSGYSFYLYDSIQSVYVWHSTPLGTEILQPLVVDSTMQSTALVGGSSLPSVASCGTIGANSTNTAGFITSATTGSCVSILIFNGVTAPHGWSCGISDSTTANLIRQTDSTTTSATFTGATVSGDVLRYFCAAY